MGAKPGSTSTALFILLLSLVSEIFASVTVQYAPGYGPQATLGGVANTTLLSPPPLPTNAPSPSYTLTVELTNPQNVSIPIPAGFIGYSIEMSVANQILGKNSTLIQVPFLNLMANLIKRSGIVKIRVGGNTQENAILVDTLDNGRVLEKQQTTDKSPPLTYTRDLLNMMRKISDFVNIHWYTGAAYAPGPPWNMDMMVISQQILGDYLDGIQAGNEPDQYNFNNRNIRNSSYFQPQYFTEFGQFISQMNGNDSIVKKNLLLGPGISNQWKPETVWDTGYVDAYNDSLAALVVERYPDDYCAFIFPSPTNPIRNPQDLFSNYLTHASSVNLVANYRNSSQFALSKGKQIIMFETNTAACGGFPGISDSFGAALWGIDYGLQLASWGFSGALFHIGGQTAFYNPFTPPPTNQSSFRGWSVGPMYYASVVVNEVIGSSGQAQLRDLAPNNNAPQTPAYGVWEGGNLVKLAFINYNNDPTGGMDSKATFTGPAGAGSLKIKQLKASSISQKFNYTWNGQTWGDVFQSDGRPLNQELVETIPCTNSQCTVTVPAPGVVVVYLSDDAYNNAESAAVTQTGQGAQGGSMTFSTTARTQSYNTATVASSVLVTSNGMKGFTDDKDLFGSTSRGKSGAHGVTIGLGFLSLIILGLMMTIFRTRH